MGEVKQLKKSNNNGKSALPKIIEEATADLNSYEVIGLWQILESMRNGNNYVPPSIARFLAKNFKKLVGANKKTIGEEEALKLEYWEKDVEGRKIYTDGIEDYKKPVSEGEEDTGEIIYGTKAYLDEKKNLFFDIKTGDELPVDKAMRMKIYIPKEKIQEYSEKLNALKEQKHTVHVTKINLDYMEDMRIAIPTGMTVSTNNPQNPKEVKKIPLDLDSFFEYLIIGGDDKPENLN